MIYLFQKYLLSHSESSNKVLKTSLQGKLIHIYIFSNPLFKNYFKYYSQ